MRKFDAILFDFDGVLADTEPIHFAAWRDALARFGVDLAAGREREFAGVSDRAMIEQIAAEQSPPLPADRLWTSYPDKQALFRERVAADPPITRQTKDLLAMIHQDYKLAVVSSSDRSEIEPVLERAAVLPLFHILVCGMEVRNLKPAPDPYLRAAELLGANRPLVIEDSETGVRAGLAAGFEVLRLSHPEALTRELTQFLADAG